MSLYQFLESRICAGRMDAVAIARANKAIRLLPRKIGLMLSRTSQPDGKICRAGRLTATGIEFRTASAMVNMHHRHHASPVGHLFSGAVYDGDVMCGAVIAGRPESRHLDDGDTVELLRVVSDGTRNVCSKAYGWAVREARRRGYSRVITYTLPEEGGASLRAAGFVQDAVVAGGSWHRDTRMRKDNHPTGKKIRWFKQLRGQ